MLELTYTGILVVEPLSLNVNEPVVDELSLSYETVTTGHKVNENEFVAITNVGAYGSSLSSNYNTRPLVAEILINKNKLRYIRKKQNLLKLINS